MSSKASTTRRQAAREGVGPAAVAGPPASVFPLLSLPPACISAVFNALAASFTDSVSLSLCNKELWGLGASARHRHLCCAACGHTVLDPAVAFAGDTWRDAPALTTQDGETYAVDAAALRGCRSPGCCAAGRGATTGTGGASTAGSSSCSPHSCGTRTASGAWLGPEAPLQDSLVLFTLRAVFRIRGAGLPTCEVRAREVLCGGCGLHLGLAITQLGRLRQDSTAACISNWRELQLLGTCFLVKQYLRLRRRGGQEEHVGSPPPPGSLALYRCTAARSQLRAPGGCGAVLFSDSDILCRQHCWDAGGGQERAFYINTFRPGAVQPRNERLEMLCQGEMRVADVHCTTCGSRIGWKFCADLSPGLQNCNQVGRYGVVVSSICKDKHAAAQGD